LCRELYFDINLSFWVVMPTLLLLFVMKVTIPHFMSSSLNALIVELPFDVWLGNEPVLVWYQHLHISAWF
jgi:hypothetical protein